MQYTLAEIDTAIEDAVGPVCTKQFKGGFLNRPSWLNMAVHECFVYGKGSENSQKIIRETAKHINEGGHFPPDCRKSAKKVQKPK